MWKLNWINSFFVTILQQQQRVISFLNYIKNSNKLDLFILFKILSFLDFKNTTFLKLFFNFENSFFFDSINFNKFSKIIKLLNIF